MESKNNTDAVSVLALLDPTDTSNQINSDVDIDLSKIYTHSRG